MKKLSRILAHQEASSSAEFALVLPVLILFLLGIIDVGRYMWSLNKIEKATQMGARMAVVTAMVPTDLANQNFGSTLGQGNTIPTSSFGEIKCDKSGGSLACTCVSSCSGIGMTADATAYSAIATRMNLIAPMVKSDGSTIRISYKNSGLGYAGDPNGSDVAPIVTVSAVGVPFRPLIFQFLGGRLVLPTVSASLTLEDGQGASSN